MAIGENIRFYRNKRNLSQRELGDRLGGISQQQIGQWENNIKKPKVETQIKLAEALGIPVSLLNDTLGWLKEPCYLPLEKKLERIGYTLGYNDDGYLWINYPDGSLLVTEDDLKALEKDTDSYLLFKLQELKSSRTCDFSKRESE